MPAISSASRAESSSFGGSIEPPTSTGSPVTTTSSPATSSALAFVSSPGSANVCSGGTTDPPISISFSSGSSGNDAFTAAFFGAVSSFMSASESLGSEPREDALDSVSSRTKSREASPSPARRERRRGADPSDASAPDPAHAEEGVSFPATPPPARSAASSSRWLRRVYAPGGTSGAPSPSAAKRSAGACGRSPGARPHRPATRRGASAAGAAPSPAAAALVCFAAFTARASAEAAGVVAASTAARRARGRSTTCTIL